MAPIHAFDLRARKIGTVEPPPLRRPLDPYQDLFAWAISPRLIFADYTGPAYRGWRSGGTQQDVFFGSVDGLEIVEADALALSGTGNDVHTPTLYDQTGLGNNLTMAQTQFSFTVEDDVWQDATFKARSSLVSAVDSVETSSITFFAALARTINSGAYYYASLGPVGNSTGTGATFEYTSNIAPNGSIANMFDQGVGVQSYRFNDSTTVFDSAAPFPSVSVFAMRLDRSQQPDESLTHAMWLDGVKLVTGQQTGTPASLGPTFPPRKWYLNAATNVGQNAWRFAGAVEQHLDDATIEAILARISLHLTN